MHIHNLDQWRHEHNFFVSDAQNEKNTLMVVSLTLSPCSSRSTPE
jgi:hypothetical protein